MKTKEVKRQGAKDRQVIFIEDLQGKLTTRRGLLMRPKLKVWEKAMIQADVIHLEGRIRSSIAFLKALDPKSRREKEQVLVTQDWAPGDGEYSRVLNVKKIS
jgi:hypothetical protein